MNAPAAPGRPLVTFALFAYNQEQYVRQAIEGAFGQTYEPLEIILSDDCSSDRTFEIMQEMAAAYRGPHQVVVRQSPANRGLTGHVNDVAALARGEIIVPAAGDDISYAHRTATIAPFFKEGVFATYSAHTEMDTDGRSGGRSRLRRFPVGLGEAVFNGGGIGLGAAYAYRRECFIPRLDETLRSEDRVLPFRALLKGRMAYVPEYLVAYRVHPQSLSNELVKSRSRARHDRHHLQVLALEARGAGRSRAYVKLALTARRVVNALSWCPGERILETTIGKAFQLADRARRRLGGLSRTSHAR